MAALCATLALQGGNRDPARRPSHAPVFVMVIFGAIPDINKPEAKLGGLSYFSVYFPILIAFSVTALA